jgi:hypothetical protein
MIASSARPWQVIDLQMCVRRAYIADRSKQCALPELIDRQLEAETNQAISFQNTHCCHRRSEAERFHMITARFHGGQAAGDEPIGDPRAPCLVGVCNRLGVQFPRCH